MNIAKIKELERKAYIEQNELALSLYSEIQSLIETGLHVETECMHCSVEVHCDLSPEELTQWAD